MGWVTLVLLPTILVKVDKIFELLYLRLTSRSASPLDLNRYKNKVGLQFTQFICNYWLTDIVSIKLNFLNGRHIQTKLIEKNFIGSGKKFHIYTVDVRTCFLKYPHTAFVSIAVCWTQYVIYKYVFQSSWQWLICYTRTYIPEQCPVPKLSEEEKKLLVFSWNQVERDADRIGAVTFMK